MAILNDFCEAKDYRVFVEVALNVLSLICSSGDNLLVSLEASTNKTIRHCLRCEEVMGGFLDITGKSCLSTPGLCGYPVALFVFVVVSI